MTTETLAFGLSLSSLLVILGIAWKGGHILGQFQEAISGFKDAIRLLTEDLNQQRDLLMEHGRLIEHSATLLNELDKRVEKIERRR